jgi:hypothetical protein
MSDPGDVLVTDLKTLADCIAASVPTTPLLTA